MSKHLLNQLRQKGIQVYFSGPKIELTPTELITEKIQRWLRVHKTQLLRLIKKEQYLRKRIENVGRHDNWTNEEIEEMFEFAMSHINLDVAISSYQTTAARQACLISLSYKKAVFFKTCQKHIFLSEKQSYEILTCPICEKRKELNSCLKTYYIW